MIPGGGGKQESRSGGSYRNMGHGSIIIGSFKKIEHVIDPRVPVIAHDLSN